jgi:hypothetical protein
MRTIINGGQQDEAWRKLRLGCATASNFGTVQAKGRSSSESLTRRKYLVTRALEIVTGVPTVPMRPSRAMQVGIDREPDGCRAFENATGHVVEHVSFVRLNRMAVGCSPDGLIDDDAGFEIKCPDEDTHYDYLSLVDKPPAVYIAQVQGCLFVTGRSHWYFASYNPAFPPELQLHYVRVERDEDYIAKLETALWLFSSEVSTTVQELRQLMQQRSAL